MEAAGLEQVKLWRKWTAQASPGPPHRNKWRSSSAWICTVLNLFLRNQLALCQCTSKMTETKTEWQIKREHNYLGNYTKNRFYHHRTSPAQHRSGISYRDQTLCMQNSLHLISWANSVSQWQLEAFRVLEETTLRLLKMGLLNCSQNPELQRRGEAVCAQITLSEEAQTLPGVSSADSTAKEVKDYPPLLCKSLETGEITSWASKPILSEGTGVNEVTIPASVLRGQDTPSPMAQNSPCAALPALLQPSPPLVLSAQTSGV